MCVFSSEPLKVAKTKIFVCPLQEGNSQLTVYSNSVTVANGVSTAMILPYPTKDKQPCKVLDFSSYPNFFQDVRKLFPADTISKGYSSRSFNSLSNTDSALEVFDVGSYKCSIATCLEDLDRVPADVFGMNSSPVRQGLSTPSRNAFPRSSYLFSERPNSTHGYSLRGSSIDNNSVNQTLGVNPRIRKVLSTNYPKDFGFLICKIDASAEFSPIGYTHPTLPDKMVFVPTLHDHGDGVANDWDHEIYAFNVASDAFRYKQIESFPHSPFAVQGWTQGISNDFGMDYTDQISSIDIYKKIDQRKMPIALPATILSTNMRKIKIKGEQTNSDIFFESQPRVSNYGGCTFDMSANNYLIQPWFECKTCDMTQTTGVCLNCKDVCHRGHDIVEAARTMTPFFCDCGSNVANGINDHCKLLVNRKI